MKLKLVVTEPFSTRFGQDAEKVSFARGDEITETAQMNAVRKTHPTHVVQTAAEPPEGDPAFAKQTAEVRSKPAPAPDTPAKS